MTDKRAGILILDDNEVFRERLERAILKRGYTVLAAGTVADALAQARAGNPGYAVLDLNLEQETGLDAIAPLLDINPAMQILILTGYSSIATAVAAIKQGAGDYACKPQDADSILARLGLLSGMPDKVEHAAQPLSVNRVEWEHIQRVLAENDGNISATARSLGMHRRTLQRKLQKRPTRQ